MIKSEKSPKFTLKTRKIPQNTLKISRGGSPVQTTGRDFPKFSMTGGFLDNPPCTPLK